MYSLRAYSQAKIPYHKMYVAILMNIMLYYLREILRKCFIFSNIFIFRLNETEHSIHSFSLKLQFYKNKFTKTCRCIVTCLVILI